MAIVFTSANGQYLPKVRILAESVKKNCIGVNFVLFLAELNPNEWLSRDDNKLFHKVISPKELNYPDPLGWAITHNLVEYCTAVKPLVAAKIQKDLTEDVIYLDPDIAVFDSLSIIIDELSDYPVLLTPHILNAMPNENIDAITENELSVLKHGLYNLGFFAVSNNERGHKFLNWYSARLYHFCKDSISEGMFTDQRWADFAPIFFPYTKILRNPGLNVASWNLSERSISIGPNGDIHVSNEPLVFYHFSGIDSKGGRSIAEKYSNKSPIISGLWDWYEHQLIAKSNVDTPDHWSMGRLSCGFVLNKSIRKKLRQIYQPGIFGDNPFESTAENLINLLNSHENNHN